MSEAAGMNELLEVIEQEMARWKVPGVAVAVRSGGSVTSRGVGVTSIETNLPVSPDTLFRIASITKSFTATLAMMLVDEGRIDLDTPLASFIPALPLPEETLRTLSLRHLLSHCTGLEGDDWRETGHGDDALARYIAGFGELRYFLPPGEVWAYSNTGLALAGYVVATVVQQPFEEVMKERVFEPLGLERTVMYPHDAIVYPVAVGHSATPESLTIVRRYALSRGNAPAGNIIASVNDLMRYATFHLGDGTANGKRLLSETALKQMQLPQIEAEEDADAWGLGWSIRFVDGTKVVGHGGDILGMQAQLTLVPERDFAIATLTNSSQGSALNRRVVDWALEHYLSLKRVAPERVDLPQEQCAGFAGRYEHPLGRETSGLVEVRDGGLLLTIELEGVETQPLQPMPLAAVGDERFIITEGQFADQVVRFLRNEDGSTRFMHFFGRLSVPLGINIQPTR